MLSAMRRLRADGCDRHVLAELHAHGRFVSGLSGLIQLFPLNMPPGLFLASLEGLPADRAACTTVKARGEQGGQLDDIGSVLPHSIAVR